MSNHNTNDCRYKCKKCTWHTHHIRDCRNRQRDEANFTEKGDSAESTENVFYSCLKTQQGKEDVWYIDSGCSNHMTGDKNSFVQLDEGVKSNITLGDGSTQEVTGKGMISVKARNGSTKYIQDVLYVPGLAQNLLSVGQLMEKGYSVNFDNNKCVIFDKKKAQVIASVSMLSNKIFPLKMPVEQKAALSSILENSSLWHQRYGHLNPASLKVLQRRNMVIGLPSLDIRQNICEGCIMGKMHRFPFTNTS